MNRISLKKVGAIVVTTTVLGLGLGATAASADNYISGTSYSCNYAESLATRNGKTSKVRVTNNCSMKRQYTVDCMGAFDGNPTLDTGESATVSCPYGVNEVRLKNSY